MKPDSIPRPLNEYSAHFANLRLTQDSGQWRYQPTGWALFPARFIKFLGYAVMVISILQILQKPLLMVLMVLIGIVFVSLGRRIERRYALAPCFDKRRQRVTVPRQPLFKGSWITAPAVQESIAFERIKALQILQKRARYSRGGYFTSYEFNLERDDGRRFNLADHNDLAQLRFDAAKLAKLLHVRVDEYLP